MKKDHVEMPFSETALDQAKTKFKEYHCESGIFLNEACETITKLASHLVGREIDPSPKVTGRVKNFDECIKKFEDKYFGEKKEFDEPYKIQDYITDLVGVRIICTYESDIEKVAEILRENLDVFSETNKSGSLEKHANKFGYKGLHLDCRLDARRAELLEYKEYSDLCFEIQVRSIVQDAWSEVDHHLQYKKEVSEELKRPIYRLAALFELADQEFEAIRDKAIRDNNNDLEREGQSNGSVTQNDILISPLNFPQLAEKYFSGRTFPKYRVYRFVDELLRQKKDMKVGELDKALEENLQFVVKYVDYLIVSGYKMNPFTQIRHCLYKENIAIYGDLMYDSQKDNFDRWVRDHQP